jgi:hypothetical protein
VVAIADVVSSLVQPRTEAIGSFTLRTQVPIQSSWISNLLRTASLSARSLPTGLDRHIFRTDVKDPLEQAYNLSLMLECRVENHNAIRRGTPKLGINNRLAATDANPLSPSNRALRDNFRKEILSILKESPCTDPYLRAALRAGKGVSTLPLTVEGELKHAIDLHRSRVHLILAAAEQAHGGPLPLGRYTVNRWEG